MIDQINSWRAYEVQIKGELGWYVEGRITFKPGESAEQGRLLIESQEGYPCRLIGLAGIPSLGRIKFSQDKG